nr:unnamed protein product [Spirometra erinaceieuropaei]
MVRHLHDGMMARVTDNEAVSEAFAMANGVKQRCVLASTLSSLMFTAMLVDACCDERPGSALPTGKTSTLHHRRMHFQSRVSTTTVHELLFADDCALNTTRVEDITRTAPNVLSPSASPSPLTPSTNSDRVHEPPLPPSSSSTASTSSVAASVMHINTRHDRDTPADINTTNVDASDGDLDYTCPHCDFTFTSHIGLAAHLRIHRAETGESVPETPTYTRRIRLHCPHCHRTFKHA